MSLPINIKELVHGHSVEWERLEFKQSWNPEDVIHTMCAFANDINNWGGGYIVIGINEKEGQPILPPVGLPASQIDRIQREVIELGHKIRPTYLPIMQPHTWEEQHILVLWCPAGDFRPYSAPITLGDKPQRGYYIRIGSSSLVARDATLRRMYDLAARVPFDDRINQEASIDDLDVALIQAYLHEVKSDLYEESKSISLATLARNMHIAKGSDEYLRPVNVGLLFFSQTPEKFFDRAWIEVVWRRDDIGDNFTEHYFKGPLQKQLREALSFIKTNIIHEHVIKIPNQAEALRFYNYPYEAVEEALANAVYHKGYDYRSPIEVQIYPDEIVVLSYPGAVPPVNYQILNKQKVVAREYRNRRIGDFLKELELTEGRGTGFPKMTRKMRNNGSPDPIIQTDPDGISFVVQLPIHPKALEYADFIVDDQATDQVVPKQRLSSDQVTDQVVPKQRLSSDQATNGANSIIFNSLNDIIAYSNEISNEAGNGATDQEVSKLGLNCAQVEEILNTQIHKRASHILYLADDWIDGDKLFASINLIVHSKHRKKYLDPLVKLGWIELKYPDKRTHPNQRYRTTTAGRRVLALLQATKSAHNPS